MISGGGVENKEKLSVGGDSPSKQGVEVETKEQPVLETVTQQP